MFEAASYFDIRYSLASKVVNAVDAVGWGIVAASTIAAIISAGGLAVSSAIIDFGVITIKNYLSRNLKAQAIAW
ncbi:putative peptide antibiotic precursor(unsure) [Bacillus mycoides]|uniref:uberolysin/carnocyclin family circular bacteriocin n=1 Tax=Bacillus mycoides TaxID=1405 RepID=UPI0007AB77AA|nr:uberolysin/carnocyclin family circular bacteriocin [Bacillus mycoides]KZE06705.1 putative peptide antibiotic precursor(unsure) [Bacillus mycoides]SCC63187.1 Possible peptide antibiotic [Bacillus mycoides]